jgi:RNA polymerase sigma factor (sigma-70 family)
MPERIQQLSAAMAAGDIAAVDAFYRDYFDWMYSQARRMTRRDEAFCLDVVQDAVLRVIRTVKAVDSESRFRGWLRLVVQTTAFDQLRSERRRKNREAMAGSPSDEADIDSLQLDWLEQQISSLDPELIRIIELRFEESWSLRRIGEKLGLSVGAVDGRLRRALVNLKLSADDPVMEIPDHNRAGACRPGPGRHGPALLEAVTVDVIFVEAIPSKPLPSEVFPSEVEFFETPMPDEVPLGLAMLEVSLSHLEDEAGMHDDRL